MAQVIPTVLLDSVIVIDHFNGIPPATAYLLKMQGKIAISVITQAEVLTGFEGRDRQLAQRLLDRFPLLIIDRPIADLAATLRRQNGWKMPDALQAALARHHKLKFATRDTDDFPPKRHRFVLVPYTIDT
jgi:predicted nucleic acid-binding protein